jgi:DNA-binding XRE family transcriptional regulator
MREKKSEAVDPEMQEARRWAGLILQVRSGLMSATDAARELGVSRKTYYKKEERALGGMIAALTDRPCGRPSQDADGAKKMMEAEIAGMQKALLKSEQRLHAREVLLSDDPVMAEWVRKALAKKKVCGSEKAGDNNGCP